jgi:hypothetical protein
MGPAGTKFEPNGCMAIPLESGGARRLEGKTAGRVAQTGAKSRK